MELSGYITEQFHLAAASSPDNLLGDLATACATGELDEIAAQVIMITLFSAGGESTASLIGSAAWILATQPAIQKQVREQLIWVSEQNDPGLCSYFIQQRLLHVSGILKLIHNDQSPTRALMERDRR